MHLSKGLRGCRGLRWTGILSSDVQSRAPAACRCQSSATPAAQPAPPAAGDRRARNHWDMIRLKEHERPPAMPVSEYARLDAARAARCTEPPTGVQMLTRDFVADALYNPQYGYFSKRANIFRWDEPPNFTSMKDELDFMDRVAALYAQLEPKSAHLTIEGTQQVWHTPVELFRPWYGHAVAKYIVSKHREQPGKDLVIFEVGGGNGTMMANIMDFIRDNEPELYPRTRYTIIEISEQLSRQQAKLLAEARAKHTRVSLVNKSIFDWNETVSDECFFIASEVIDNFAHDLIRYDTTTLEPRQGVVLVNEGGDYSEAFEPVSDGLVTKFLDLRERIGMKSPVTNHMWLKRLRSLLPFAPNLSEAEFLPVMAMELFEVLHKYFPRHKLVLTDFSMLPDAVPGVNGPVVQIRHQGSMIPCTTYLVQPGRFDIFFPTDFDLLRAMYLAICRPEGGDAEIKTQEEFMEAWSDRERTTTLSGERPILTMYKNMKWLVS